MVLDVRKDLDIARAASSGLNVAQAVGFSPSLEQTMSAVRGHPVNRCFGSVRDGIVALFAQSPEGSVNIRTFRPEQPDGNPFEYGLKSLDLVVARVEAFARQGLFCIVNETIDVKDGGVSGVLLRGSGEGIIEFAPEDIPRCVELKSILEKGPVASLPAGAGSELLRKVYWFDPSLIRDPRLRVEFSIHPWKRGFLGDHTIYWQVSPIDNFESQPSWVWPNRYSMFLGDKAYGLLIAEAVGLPVPFTMVVPKKGSAPFQFGQRTGSAEFWTRTAPNEKLPGLYLTERGYVNPTEALRREKDLDQKNIASILYQEGVTPKFSGTALSTADGEVLVEGVEGFGDNYMLGEQAPTGLPQHVIDAVRSHHKPAQESLRASIKTEWVHDGKQPWFVQLNRDTSSAGGNIAVIVPSPEGAKLDYVDFFPGKGLEHLRNDIVPEALREGKGVRVVGNVGIGSHVGDILRRERVPSYVETMWVPE